MAQLATPALKHPETIVESRKITAAWTDSGANTKEYVVTITPANEQGDSTWTIDAQYTTASITNLAPSTTYAITIKAVATAASGDTDSDVSTPEDVATEADVVKLATPVATRDDGQTTDTKLVIVWTADAAATSYEYSWNGGAVVQNVTSPLEITGLTSGESHEFKLWAKDSAAPANDSDPFIGTLGTKTKLGTPVITRDDAATTETQLAVKWDAVPEANNYIALLDGGTSRSGTATSQTYTGLAAGSQHTITVKATRTGYIDSDIGTANLSTKVPQDTTAPVITRAGGDVSITVGDGYTDAGATAVDDVDGNITAAIVTVDPVDANVVGNYTVTYNVSDAAGNAATEVTRAVEVKALTGKAKVVIVGGNESLNEGDTYVDKGVSSVTKDDGTPGDIADITTSTNVDTTVPGSYVVTYLYPKGKSGAAADTSVSRNVVVRSTHAGADATQWLEGQQLDYKDVTNTAYDKAVDLARIKEAPKDLHPSDTAMAYTSGTAMDPYERRAVIELSGGDYQTKQTP